MKGSFSVWLKAKDTISWPETFLKAVSFKSSHWMCSVKKGALKNFPKFTGKHLFQSLFFKKVAGLPAILLERRLWYRCFPVNFANFSRATFSQNTFGRLRLPFGYFREYFHHFLILANIMEVPCQYLVHSKRSGAICETIINR